MNLLFKRHIFEQNPEVEKVFLRIHGFQDSPVTLFQLPCSVQNKSKIRLNEENSFSTACENGLVNHMTFKDFDSFYLINNN